MSTEKKNTATKADAITMAQSTQATRTKQTINKNKMKATKSKSPNTPIKEATDLTTLTGILHNPTPHHQKIARYKLATPVFFVGFMGAGKTTITRKLAHKYGLASLDADIYLEQQEGLRIKEIFREYGEEKFREAEARVLAELAEKKPLLISCGGGVIEGETSRKILKSSYVVFLNTTVTQAKNRISNYRSRPLFKQQDAAENLNDRRLPLYRSIANVEIDTGNKPASVIVKEVSKILMRNEVLMQE